MREGSNRIVSTIYEIATTERACVRVMRSCPLYLFHGSNDGTGWLREITKNATSAAFLKNKQDNNSCENMSAQSPKKKPRGTAQKTSPSTTLRRSVAGDSLPVRPADRLQDSSQCRDRANEQQHRQNSH